MPTARLLVGVAVAAILVVAVTAFDLVAVTGGSMEPAIEPGDVTLVCPYVTPAVGDVVLFEHEDGDRVLHRVEEVFQDGSLRTRGDANDRSDRRIVSTSDVLGVVLSVIPCGRVRGPGT